MFSERMGNIKIQDATLWVLYRFYGFSKQKKFSLSFLYRSEWLWMVDLFSGSMENLA